MEIRKRRTHNTTLIALLVFVAIIMATGLIGFVVLNSNKTSAPVPTEESKRRVTTKPSTPNTPELLTASDETLGSGFAINYPASWSHSHTGAPNPQSSTVQTDETIITSPSGLMQVIMRTQTNTRVGRSCTSDFIKLRYLSTDTTPKFSDGRFAAYVVYFPSLNLYQYHVGLQKNTEAIRGVGLTTNTACNFMFSEFIERNSSLPNVPLTRTLLSIRFLDLQEGDNLKPGITETQVVEKLISAEYEQAKQIVQSVHVN